MATKEIKTLAMNVRGKRHAFSITEKGLKRKATPPAGPKPKRYPVMHCAAPSDCIFCRTERPIQR